MAFAVALGSAIFWLAFNVAPGKLEGPALRIALSSDLVNYFVPMTQYVGMRLAAGEAALWNPHFCSGIPLLATLQNTVFQPRAWLAASLPAHQAIAVTAFALCTIGAGLAAWMFWRWTRDAFAALMGGLLFLSVCLLGYTFWPPAIETLVWLPFMMICVDMLARVFSPGVVVGLAVAVAMQVFAGFPQLLVYNFALLGPYALYRLLGDRGASAPALLGRASALLLAVGLGLGLSGLQLLPGIELVSESARVKSLTPDQLHYLTGDHSRVMSDVVARAFNPAPDLAISALGGADYLGISTLILIVVGVVGALRVGRTWLLVAVGAAALILADGYNGALPALYAAWAKLPVVGALRTPERLRIVTEFCCICLAVVGFDRLSKVRPGDAPLLRAAAVGAVAVVAAGMALLGTHAGVWRALLAGGMALGLIQARRGSASHTGLRLSLVVLVFGDLLLATGAMGILRAFPTDWAEVYRADRGDQHISSAQLDVQLREVGYGRLSVERYWPLMILKPSQWGYRTDCYEPLVPGQWAALHRELTGEFAHRTTLEPRSGDAEVFEPFLDVAGIVRTLRPGPRGRLMPELNADALPRAYWIDRYRVVSDEAAIVHVARGDLDLQSLVLLDRDPEIPLGERGLRAAFIVDYAPERVEIAVEPPAAGMLVLSDSHYPGWQVRVDGEPREIFKANGLYRAVALEPGDRRVVFEYRPASFRNGAILSAFSLAACGLLVASPLLRRTAPPRIRKG